MDGLANADNFGIDFGDDLDAVELGNDTIDFGEGEISLADTADICVEEDGTEIDFGIETVDESSMQKPIDFEKTDASGKYMALAKLASERILLFMNLDMLFRYCFRN